VLGGIDLPVLLWVLAPVAAVHLALVRRRAWLTFQLLLDAMLLLLPGRMLLSGAHLGPGVAGGEPWGAPTTVAGSGEQSDLPLEFSVWWEEVRRLVASGEPPWVSDRIGGGTPLFDHGQSELPFPLQAPVWALGAARGTDVMAIWKLELAALGAFLLLARLRLRPAAAAAGALAFSFGLYQLSWLVVPLAWVVAATPLAWWALIGALRGRRRDAAALAVLLGVLAGWSVHAETAAFLWLAVGGGGVVMAWGRWRRLRRLAAPFALACPVAAVGAIPTLAAIAGSSKLGGLLAAPGYPMAGVDWPLRLRLAALLLVPWRDGHPAGGGWSHPFPAAAVSLSVGAVAIALLLAALPRRRLRRVALALAVVGAASAALVWQVSGFAEIGARVPVLRLMTWARAGFLASFALAMLAAMGADAWLRKGLRSRFVAACASVQIAVLALCLTASPVFRPRLLATAWTPAAAAVLVPALGAGGGWAVPGLVGLEECLQGWSLLPASRPAARGKPQPLLAALQREVAAEGGRILGTGGALPANLAARLGLADLRVHDPVRSQAQTRLDQALGAAGLDLPGDVTTPWAGLAGAWGVRWLVTPPAGVTGVAAASWEEVAHDEVGRIYRNPRALPVLRLVTRTTEPPGAAGAGAWEGVDFATTAVTHAHEVLGGSGTLQIVEQRPYRWVARVDARGTVLVVLHTPQAPGWGAWLDGSRAQIVDADLGAMGVVVPSGRHEVRWEYAPRGLWLGVGLTLAGLAGCVGLGLVSWRRWR
jgi:hypothetical protein